MAGVRIWGREASETSGGPADCAIFSSTVFLVNLIRQHEMVGVALRCKLFRG